MFYAVWLPLNCVPGISKSSKISPPSHLRILFTVGMFTGDKKSLTPDKISRVVRSAVSVSGCPNSVISRLSLANCGKISGPGFPCDKQQPGPGSAENCDSLRQQRGKLRQRGRAAYKTWHVCRDSGPWTLNVSLVSWNILSAKDRLSREDRRVITCLLKLTMPADMGPVAGSFSVVPGPA